MHYIVCFNSGSSSLKYAAYGVEGSELRCLSRGQQSSTDLAGAVADIEQALGGREPHIVGHRVVHGGARHAAPATVNDLLLDELESLRPLAPLHLPPAISGMRAIADIWPGSVQLACFDTAFHRRLPELAQRLPVPESLWDAGVRRYGFHGLSYEYVLGALEPSVDARTVVAHLGSGASLAAIRGHSPVATSMGMTPAGGVMMGTRSGDLDPGVLLYLLEEMQLEPAALSTLLNFESGLRGVSGIDSDMRVLLASADPRAALAVDMFCESVRACIGAYAAKLGGLDTLVFTGGVGEWQPAVRERICEGLEFLGVVLEPEANRTNAATISREEAECEVRVIATDEELVIARYCAEELERG